MKKLFFLLPFVCLIAGCVSGKIPDNESGELADEESAVPAVQISESPRESTRNQVIATDFVNAMQQLSELDPTVTTIHLPEDKNSDVFVMAMYESLHRAGYGLRWVSDGSRQHFLQYRSEIEASDRRTKREVYELAVGGIEMRRTYDTDLQGVVKPLTPLYVRGADATGIVLDDSVFDIQPGPLEANKNSLEHIDSGSETGDIPAQQLPAAYPIPQPGVEDLATDSDEARSQVSSSMLTGNDTSPLDPLIAGTAVKPLTMPLIDLPKVENVFDLGGSNFQDILTDYEIVAEQILMFPNDSLRLGDANKQFIDRMVKQFDTRSDIFSVVGCSLGPTAVSGGNAALALGRANRVVEALLFAGVDEDRILDEGCWASQSNSNALPARGVVLTLNRN